MKKINWEKVWARFNDWIHTEEAKSCRCKKCGVMKYISPDWKDQQDKIEKLVNKQCQS